MTTGELKGMWNNTYYECVDCQTVYPVLEIYDKIDDTIIKSIMCNGHKIKVCPFCRIDSKPWMYGRGI